MATVALTTVGASVIQVLAGVTVGVLVIVALLGRLERGALKLVSASSSSSSPSTCWSPAFGPGGPVPRAARVRVRDGRETDASRVLTLGVGGVVLLAAVIAIVVLATIWMRRTRTPIEDPVQETRTIDRGALADTPAAGRRREPTSAHASRTTRARAYVALMADLDRHPSVRRAVAETPAEHAPGSVPKGAPGSCSICSQPITPSSVTAARTCQRVSISAALGRWRSLRRRLTRERT